ncbi:MAG: hypothetical protein O7D29_07940 [Gemmatimonadetes bacterium]|nr:hypothetical protein [Gemmatimonadota bacterium]
MINHGGVRGTIVVVILAVSALSLAAQDVPLPWPGDRVRVTAPDRSVQQVEGRLLRLRADTLAVWPATEGSPLLFIPLSSLTSLQVRRHRFWGAREGAKYGAIVGGSLGVVFAAWACQSKDCEVYTVPVYLAFGFWFGATGSLVGAVIGAIGGRVWEEVAVDQLRVSFRPQRDGRFALAFSVAF